MVTATVKRCGNCAYWSDLVDRVRSDGSFEALCLRQRGEGPYAQDYTTVNQTCCAWEAGEPIDVIEADGR